jgi:MFS family permease
MSRRAIILSVFLTHAVAGCGIFPRIPDIQSRLGLEESVLGIALTLGAVGGLLANLVAGRVVGALGTRAILVWGLPALAALSALAAMAPNVAALFAAMLAMGVAFSLVNVAMNVEADRVEAATGRRVMNRCHAVWSGGVLLAALVGVGARAAGIAPGPHLLVFVPPALLMTLALVRRMEPCPVPPGDRTRRPGIALPSRRTVLLVLFGLSGSVAQSAVQNWSVIFMRDMFLAPVWLETLSLPAYLVAMTAGRVFADGWTERFGPVRVAAGQTWVAILGAVVVATAPGPGIALLGFAFLGLGTAALFPLMVSAAARSGERSAAEAVSAVILSMGAVMLVVPAAIGWIAEGWGLRTAFSLLLPAMGLTLLLARIVAARPAGKAVPAG